MRITNEQNDIESVLITGEEIRARVNELGSELSRDYDGKDPLVVCILKGAAFFHSDLCRSMRCRAFPDYIAVSSYGQNAQSTGVVRIVKDLDQDMSGRHVILVDDIIDSGLTLQYLVNLFLARQPASVRTVCLLDKCGRRKCEISADYCGFVIPDRFVVGYGLDYAEHYRTLPYVGVLRPEAYA